MVICAAKLRWRELSAAASLALALMLCVVGGRSPGRAVSALTPQPGASDPGAYLAELGWTVEGEPSRDQVALPERFDGPYQDYLRLQREAGFDLEPLAGSVVTRYTFTLTNYPTGEAGVLADVMVLDGRIVGGDIRSPALDGFMEPLKPRG